MTMMPSQFNLLNATITTAVTAATTTPITGLVRAESLAIQCNFAYGSGGTSVDVYVQTTLDAGTTWIDIAEFSMTTSNYRKGYNLTSETGVTSVTAFTDGSLSANTSVNGFLGDQIRLKYTTVGTYAGGTTLAVTGVAKAGS